MKRIRQRAKFVLLLFIFWCIIITIYLFNFSIYSRQNYINNSNSLSLRKGIIPANRGYIYDRNGHLITWSERYYDLYLKKTSSNNKYKQLIKQLKQQFSDIQINYINSNNYSVIKKHLTPEEIKTTEDLLSIYPELLIIPSFKRFTINQPNTVKIVGIAEHINGKWVGVNGLEKDYNNYLNGTDGIYSVMIDKKGKWIKGTWKIIKKMEPGKDLYLNQNLEK